MANQRRPLPLLVSLLAVLSLALAGCGDDDDDTTESGSATTEAPAQAGSPTEYCEKSLAIETVEDPDIDFETATPEEIKAATKKVAGETYLPLAKEVQAVTPAGIKSDVDLLVTSITKVAETGDFSAFEVDPAVQAAGDRVHAYDLKTCGWGKQTVTAVDYGFTGVSPDVKAGPTSFDLTNTGKEMHEVTLLKKKAGVTESFAEIVKLSEEEGRKKVDLLGGIDPTAPGENDYAVVELEKGEYLMVCFLPEGMTPEIFGKLESGGGGPPPEGKPHAELGMLATVTVS